MNNKERTSLLPQRLLLPLTIGGDGGGLLRRRKRRLLLSSSSAACSSSPLGQFNVVVGGRSNKPSSPSQP
ncbi:unnamed protein product [Linum trigynum]|uniref:Uncharacterized protein n=1 Tax=Linum trigynum TaxID=586398 RepID=A0AAV2GUW0_9ROSI